MAIEFSSALMRQDVTDSMNLYRINPPGSWPIPVERLKLERNNVRQSYFVRDLHRFSERNFFFKLILSIYNKKGIQRKESVIDRAGHPRRGVARRRSDSDLQLDAAP